MMMTMTMNKNATYITEERGWILVTMLNNNINSNKNTTPMIDDCFFQQTESSTFNYKSTITKQQATVDSNPSSYVRKRDQRFESKSCLHENTPEKNANDGK